MLKQEDLIKTREFWVETLSNTMWRAIVPEHHAREESKYRKKADECDATAESLVDDRFMAAIEMMLQKQKK